MPFELIIAAFCAINLLAFLIMLNDKARSRRKDIVGSTERVSEGMLFFLAVMFGALGVYAGMFAFRHKTRKWYFVLGIPMAIAQNLATLYTVSLLLAEPFSL